MGANHKHLDTRAKRYKKYCVVAYKYWVNNICIDKKIYTLI